MTVTWTLVILVSCFGASDRTCGVDAVQAALSVFGVATDRETIARNLPRGGDFVSFAELQVTLEQDWGLAVETLKWRADIPADRLPAIVLIVAPDRLTHYVTITHMEGRQLHLQDRFQAGLGTFSGLRRAGWDGSALHVSQHRHAVTGWKSPLFLGSVSVFVASLVVWFRLWQWVPRLRRIAT